MLIASVSHPKIPTFLCVTCDFFKTRAKPRGSPRVVDASPGWPRLNRKDSRSAACSQRKVSPSFPSKDPSALDRFLGRKIYVHIYHWSADPLSNARDCFSFITLMRQLLLWITFNQLTPACHISLESGTVVKLKGPCCQDNQWLSDIEYSFKTLFKPY